MPTLIKQIGRPHGHLHISSELKRLSKEERMKNPKFFLDIKTRILFDYYRIWELCLGLGSSYFTTLKSRRTFIAWIMAHFVRPRVYSLTIHKKIGFTPWQKFYKYLTESSSNSILSFPPILQNRCNINTLIAWPFKKQFSCKSP